MEGLWGVVVCIRFLMRRDGGWKWRYVRTNAITIPSQAGPDLGGADDVDWGWVSGGIDVKGCDCEEVGVSGL